MLTDSLLIEVKHLHFLNLFDLELSTFQSSIVQIWLYTRFVQLVFFCMKKCILCLSIIYSRMHLKHLQLGKLMEYSNPNKKTTWTPSMRFGSLCTPVNCDISYVVSSHTSDCTQRASFSMTKYQVEFISVISRPLL